VGAPDNLHAAAQPDPDLLIWPPPSTDLDILWLDNSTSPTSNNAASTTSNNTPSTSNNAPSTSNNAPSTSNNAPSTTAAAPASGQSVPLSRLRSPGITFEWYDAVALVQQLLDQLAPDRARPPAGSMPPLETIRLEPTGRLSVNLNPPGEPFVRGVGKLLTELLQSNPAPANLRLVAWQAASDSASQLRLDELGQQLAEWERPGRGAALAALYARALKIPAETTIPVHAAEPIPTPTPKPAPAVAQDPAASRRKRKILYASAAAGIVLLASVAAFSIGRTAGSAGISKTVGRDIELPRGSSARRTRGGASAKRASGIKRAAATTTAVGAGSMASNEPASPKRPTGDKAALSLAPLVIAPMDSANVASASPSDDAIVEPVLIRPYLPIQAPPGTPLDSLGVLELWINTHGNVESVHLKSPGNRYRERWWVFTAKSWQFQPATKNGKPIRFLKRIPLTDLNVLEPQ